jgi:hypothetical protein
MSCAALTSWERGHAQEAFRMALLPRPARPQRRVRPLVRGDGVIAALHKCWATQNAPAGKRLAPFMPELVARMHACRESDISDETAATPGAMRAATIDRRLASDRKRPQLDGRSGTKPGSLLKPQLAIRTWADWDDDEPGFVEIDLVSHEGGNPPGDIVETLTATDWTETATKNRAQRLVFAALLEIRAASPRPRLKTSPPDQQQRVHQRPPAALLHRRQDHLYRTAGGQEKRRHLRRAQELVGGTSHGWLPQLRHQQRIRAAQRDLRAATPADQLLYPRSD